MAAPASVRPMGNGTSAKSPNRSGPGADDDTNLSRRLTVRQGPTLGLTRASSIARDPGTDVLDPIPPTGCRGPQHLCQGTARTALVAALVHQKSQRNSWQRIDLLRNILMLQIVLHGFDRVHRRQESQSIRHDGSRYLVGRVLVV